MKTVVIAILAVLLAGSLASNYLEFKRYSSRRAIIRIGDQSITKKDYEDQLDYKYGRTVLNKLAYKALIDGAAAKAGVTPKAKDIDDRIAQMNRRTPALISAARSDPDQMAQLRDDLQTDIAFENLRIKDIKVSDAEVTDFYNKHRSAFELPAQVKTTIAVAGNAVDASTAAELFRQNMSVDLIARQPRIKVVGVGGFALPAKLPPDLVTRLNQAVYKLQVGDVATVAAGPRAFLIIKVNQRSSDEVPPLASIRPAAERMVKLAKAPPAGPALTQLFHDANVTFEVDKYAAYFTEITDAASKLDKKTNEPKTN